MRFTHSNIGALPVGAALLALSGALQAQDVSVQAGQLRVNDTGDKSFAVAVAYAHPVGDYLALSLSYLNEGHPPNHHRDGAAAQVWLRSKINQDGLSFGVGAGQDYYFDTERLPTGYSNDHGWAPIYSLQATYHHQNRWYTQVQVNRVLPSQKQATTQLLVGFGYRFDGVRGNKLHLEGASTDDTVTLLSGRAIVNSLNSEQSHAYSVEYRRAVGKYIDWTVTGLKEGTTARTRRAGVATQAWLIRSLNDNIELGMGFGPYGVLDLHDVPGRQSHLAGLLSVVTRYHFNKRIVGQLLMQRVITDYHRDADVLLLGLGTTF